MQWNAAINQILVTYWKSQNSSELCSKIVAMSTYGNQITPSIVSLTVSFRLAIMASERLLILQPHNWSLRRDYGMMLYFCRYDSNLLCLFSWSRWFGYSSPFKLTGLTEVSAYFREYEVAVQELSICMAFAPEEEAGILEPFVEKLHLLRLESSWKSLGHKGPLRVP